MTAPTRVADHSVRLTHRNGGTTLHADLTLDEARDLATRSVNQRKARTAEILNPAGNVVGFAEVYS